ncbi:hypothetical protein [Ornithinimicrobium kibberense]|uniref:hypothetical protein n=1 Tax=Ornithinimicrobium kibberense TaxID=282060 RepID=UPI003618B770
MALTASWPSRSTVADRGNSSPTTERVGRRPASTTGSTSRTGMRPTGCWPKRARTDRSIGSASGWAGGVVESSVTRLTLPGIGWAGHPEVGARAAARPVRRGRHQHGARSCSPVPYPRPV